MSPLPLSSESTAAHCNLAISQSSVGGTTICYESAVPLNAANTGSILAPASAPSSQPAAMTHIGSSNIFEAQEQVPAAYISNPLGHTIVEPSEDPSVEITASMTTLMDPVATTSVESHSSYYLYNNDPPQSHVVVENQDLASPSSGAIDEKLYVQIETTHFETVATDTLTFEDYAAVEPFVMSASDV